MRPLPLVLALQAVIAGQVSAAGFTVGTGSTITTSQSLTGAGIVQQGGTLSTSGSTVAVNVGTGTSTLTNAGTIKQTGSGRTIDANTGTPVLTIRNEEGALIDAVGNVAIRLNRPAGQYIIDNQGTISQSGVSVGGERAIKADADYTSTGNQIINGAADNRDATISSTGNDALRLGSNFTLTNYGRIVSTGTVNTSCPDYISGQCANDYSAADGVAIENARGNVAILNHGSIEGPRHGIDGGDPLAADADADMFGLERLIITSADGNGVTFSKVVDGVTTTGVSIANPVVINYADGTIIGNNGSGIGLDGHGVVFNYGLISGRYAGAGNVYDHEGLGVTTSNGDGDGVDIDGMAYIENHGRIEGLGAGGLDSGGNPNGADGIAAGGGTIINGANGEIFGQSKGILIDDGASGTASATGRGTDTAHGGAARIDNAGSIIGADETAIGLVGDYADVLINRSGGVIRGGADSTLVDQLSSTTAGAAVQMGAGDDQVLNAGLIEGQNGLALDLGDGDDRLILQAGSRFVGSVTGGAGTDRVLLDDAAGGSFGNSSGFELLQVLQGSWSLDSDDFSNGAEVLGGSLRNLGRIAGDVQVASGAGFGGGQVGGDLSLASGSRLILDVAADGSHNPTSVSGSASIAGATLQIVAGSGDYPRLSQYSVLQADGGISGQFAMVSSNLAFLTPELSYGSDSVELELRRNDLAYADLASSGNGRNVANVIQASGSGELYQILLGSDAEQARRGLEQLAASSNASMASATLAGGAQIGSSMLSAMQQMGGSGNLQASLLREDGPQLAASGVPRDARGLNDPNAAGRLWLQGLGSHGKLDADSGDIRQDSAGAVLGADWALGSAWRLGVLGGYGRTDVDADNANNDIDSLHLGLYAQHQSGPLALRLGASYSWHDNSGERDIDFSGFSDHLRADYDANSQQAFAELGYQLAQGRLLAEPFAAIGYQRYSHESYDEKGGAAALHVEEQDQDNVSSTLGVRVAHLGSLDNGMSLTPRASLGWRHTFGELESSARQSFLTGGDAFSVEGAALDRNSLLVEAGVDLGLSAEQSLGLGYSGELGSDAQNHALLLQWQARF
ncbi:autotransporter family protein [Pseudomonas sp. Gutcm_11s]|uniref:autotransporter family protein n=1 Tax=Pseudomonas sp. Gutcm_11s TaxID=3026088 RepID=UPI00235F891E|nr:autotransporter domain-containing protein [Pseudomonas sp. Gutcm_11s]MDD0842454.1 autotransporter domain-containing protein [Pseudomonas sp. Gutcm_11s]